MLAFKVTVSVIWLVGCVFMAIGWYLDFPVGAGEKFTIAYAMLFVLMKFISDAIDEYESATMRRYRELSRRSQI